MKAYVGVTDGDWFRFLAARPDLAEVNFWRPGGGRGFHVLAVGEPFFFKSHAPHNQVVGGGFYSGFARLKLSEAWEFYGHANGAEDLPQMRRRIGRYRREPIRFDEDPEIGCLFIRDVTFFEPGYVAEPPPEFAPNIVQGRSYDLALPEFSSYFRDLLLRMVGTPAVQIDLAESWHRPGPVYGDPRLVPQRLGQQAFQAVVLDAYHRRCAITGAKIRPVLQAARIRPLPAGGEHRLDNGLLLRSDVHTLYDRGLTTDSWSVRDSAASSATASSSTPKPASTSPSQLVGPTNQAANTSNGTSPRFSKPESIGAPKRPTRNL